MKFIAFHFIQIFTSNLKLLSIIIKSTSKILFYNREKTKLNSFYPLNGFSTKTNA